MVLDIRWRDENTIQALQLSGREFLSVQQRSRQFTGLHLCEQIATKLQTQPDNLCLYSQGIPISKMVEIGDLEGIVLQVCCPVKVAPALPVEQLEMPACGVKQRGPLLVIQ